MSLFDLLNYSRSLNDYLLRDVDRLHEQVKERVMNKGTLIMHRFLLASNAKQRIMIVKADNF